MFDEQGHLRSSVCSAHEGVLSTTGPSTSYALVVQSSALKVMLKQVMGIITRKDIAEANAKLALGRKATLGLTTPSERLVRHGTLPFIPYGAYDPTVGYSSSR